LDSGASISCVGGRLTEEIKASGNYKKIKGHATTADGRSQQILGHLKVEVEYIDKKSAVKLYVVPSLKQDLYLGIDFWRLYDLLPKNISIS